MIGHMPQRIKVEELTGIQDPTVEEVMEFLGGLPKDAKVEFTGAKYVPMEHGTEPWRVEVTWREGTL
jgi:hypothetical protein